MLWDITQRRVAEWDGRKEVIRDMGVLLRRWRTSCERDENRGIIEGKN
jgi:hypothetical protein